ncbi:MAG: ABC transporter substrate-binding protein [Leptolyngbyaceae cyanobacterium]
MNDKIELFISYSHRDEGLRDELDTHLSTLKVKGIISTWHDRQIPAGSEWSGDIDRNLKKADIILLLISPDFIGSEYCCEVELAEAMNRHNKGEAIVIPIILRPTDWTDMSFGRLQSFPKDAKPVTTWSNRDAAFKNIAVGIRKVVKELHKKRQVTIKQKELNKALYKEKVKELLLREGKIGIIERRTLNELQNELNLTSEEAKEIENEAFLPIEEYNENVARYEDTLRDILHDGEDYPFNEAIRNSLQGRQHDRGIKPLDARKAEIKVLREFGIKPIEVEQELKSDVVKHEFSSEPGRSFDTEDPDKQPVTVRSESKLSTEVLDQQPVAAQRNNKTWSVSSIKLKRKAAATAFCGALLVTCGTFAWLNSQKEESFSKELEAKISSDLLKNISYGENYLLENSGDSNFEPEKRIRNENERLDSGDLCGGKSYTVAVPVPASGEDPNKPAEMLRGFAQAQSEVNNKCGIRGKGLRLLIVDDADDPDVTKTVSEKILELKNVLAVVGHWTSNVSLKAAEVYKDKLVLVTPISIFDDLLTEDYSYVFLMNPTSQRGAEALSQYLVDNNYKRASIIYASENAYAQELATNFKTEFEKSGELVQQPIPFDSLVTDELLIEENIADPILQNVSEEDRALVLFPSIRSTRKAIRLLEYIEAASLAENISVIGDMANLYTGDVLKTSSALDMVLAVSWHFDIDSDLACAARSYWDGGNINYATAMSYYALKAVVEAMNESNFPLFPFFNSPSRSSIHASLGSGIKVEYAGNGTFSFDKSTGASNIPVQLVQIKDTEDISSRKSRSGSTNGFDFVPLDQNGVPLSYKECDT